MGKDSSNHSNSGTHQEAVEGLVEEDMDKEEEEAMEEDNKTETSQWITGAGCVGVKDTSQETAETDPKMEVREEAKVVQRHRSRDKHREEPNHRDRCKSLPTGGASTKIDEAQKTQGRVSFPS